MDPKIIKKKMWNLGQIGLYFTSASYWLALIYEGVKSSLESKETDSTIELMEIN